MSVLRAAYVSGQVVGFLAVLAAVFLLLPFPVSLMVDGALVFLVSIAIEVLTDRSARPSVARSAANAKGAS